MYKSFLMDFFEFGPLRGRNRNQFHNHTYKVWILNHHFNSYKQTWSSYEPSWEILAVISDIFDKMCNLISPKQTHKHFSQTILIYNNQSPTDNENENT